MKYIGVVGTGTMGTGIVQHLSQYDYRIVMIDLNQDLINNSLSYIDSSFNKLIKSNLITEHEKNNFLNNITSSVELNSIANCDLVIEAASESFSIKSEIFYKLDQVCLPNTIFASNTSSLSISELAAGTARAKNFLGLHFFNPVNKMPLVEIIKTISLDSNIINECSAFVKSIDKKPIISNDHPGFIVNYMLLAFILNAISMVDEGKASTYDVDAGMKYGCNHPMGPLMLADFIGLDLIYDSAKRMYDEFKSNKFVAPILLKNLVQLGYLGKKATKGFYDWTDPKNIKPSDIF